MQAGERPDAIQPRIVYQAYAVLAGLTGAMLIIWGPHWLGPSTATPAVQAAFSRLAGFVLVAFACFAMPLAAADPHSGQKGFFWLYVGHAALWVSMQFPAFRESEQSVLISAILLSVGLLFFYFWFTAVGEDTRRAPLTTLFGDARPSSVDQLRSQYEQQIRLTAAQEERNRLARDLHDAIKQQVFVVQTAAATAEARFETDSQGAKQALTEVRRAAREAMTEMDAMLDHLHAAPLENASLIEALRKQCEALEFRSGARVRLTVGDLPPNGALAPGTHQAIFRVTQEALANIGRHARARNVLVRLASTGSKLNLRIEDDGQGFDTNQAAQGMGIANMHARAQEFRGALSLNSGPRGTAIEFSIPYELVFPAEYRRRAMASGAILAAAGALWVWRPGLWRATIVGVALLGVLFIRAVYGWWRARSLASGAP